MSTSDPDARPTNAGGVPFAPDPGAARLAVGCMTGSSLDGLDAALVRIEGHGLSAQARFVAGVSGPLGPAAAVLRALAARTPVRAADIARAARDLALQHVEAIRRLLEANASGVAPDLICLHGQTVFHEPPVSWQLLQPAPVAHVFGCPVVYDLRQADLAAGGQGAPVTPVADLILFARHNPDPPWGVLNLGGFANITRIPSALGTHAGPDAITASDLCACNQVLDRAAGRALGTPFDDRGSMALSGHAVPEAVAPLLAMLAPQAAPGRSLGTADEPRAWIEPWLDRWAPTLPTSDLLRSAVEAVAAAIRPHLRGLRTLLVAGGGARNAALIDALARPTPETPAPPRVASTAELGVPVEYREAACFGVLGALCADGVPITGPGTTGVQRPAPIAGAWLLPTPRRGVPLRR